MIHLDRWLKIDSIVSRKLFDKKRFLTAKSNKKKPHITVFKIGKKGQIFLFIPINIYQIFTAVRKRQRAQFWHRRQTFDF
jgi:hypothetical protein